MDPKDNENNPVATNDNQPPVQINNPVVNPVSTNTPPPKSNTKLIIIIVSIIFALIFLLISSFFAMRFIAATVTNKDRTNEISDTSKDTTKKEVSYKFIGLSLVQSGDWKLSIVDQGGINQMKLPGTTCMVTTSQNKGDLSSLSEKDLEGISDKVADAYAKSISSKINQEVSVDKIASKDFKTSDLTDGTKDVPESVKFYGHSMQYTGVDGRTYNVKLYVKHLFNPDVELMVVAGCEKNEFNTNMYEINSAIDDIKVFYE